MERSYWRHLRALRWDDTGPASWRDRDGRLFAVWPEPVEADGILERAGGPVESLAADRWPRDGYELHELAQDLVTALHQAPAAQLGVGARGGWTITDGVTWLWLPAPGEAIWHQLVATMASTGAPPATPVRLSWHRFDLAYVMGRLTDDLADD